MQSVKIVVVGDHLDGLKVKLLTAYVEKTLSEDAPSTFFTFNTNNVTYKTKPISMQLVDTTGQEEYDMLRQLNYAHSNVFLLVCSVYHPDSIKSIKNQWVPEIRQLAPGIPYMLVGCYLDSRTESPTGQFITMEKGSKVARKIGAVGYYECSPELHDGIDELFKVAIGVGLNDPDVLKVKEIDNVIMEAKEKNMSALVYALSGLKTFPNLSECNLLKRVILNNNELTSVPFVGNLTCLEEFILDNNKITTIHKSVFLLPKLATFSAKTNCLTTSALVKDMSKMTSLTSLSLSHNPLSEFPIAATTVPSLLHLELTNCNIATLPAQIGKLSLLQDLELGSNYLSSIPPEIENLIQLQNLTLNNNSLQETLLYQIGKLSNLKHLDLSKNRLTGLPPEIGKLQNLHILQLSDNLLTYLPDEVGHLLSLKVLEIDGNELVSIPFQLGFLQLDVLLYHNNPLAISQAVQALGMRGVMTYLRDLSKSENRLYKMKLMFVGMEGVGKTTLFKKLRGHETKVSENISTNGVDIGEWSIVVKNAKERLPQLNKKLKKDPKNPVDDQISIQYSAWDFGGQELFYSTHQFFISQRSVYLIVFNLFKVDEDRVEYWLKAIRSSARKAPVLIVGSHLDHPKLKNVLAQEILEKIKARFGKKFPAITGYYAISSITGDGIEELKAAIEEVSLSQPTCGEIVPGSYKILEGMLSAAKAKNSTCPIISLNEVREFGRTCEIQDDLAFSRAIKFLHELGSICYFDRGENKLRDMVILDPQWLTNLMSSIVTFQHRFVKEGMLNMADIIHIWKPPEFPYELHNKLLAIMETLEVCCRTRENVLFPSLLPDKPLTTNMFPEILYHPAMVRVYVFDFVPFGFLSRILVRLMRTLSCSHFWKSGTYIFPKKVKECGAVGRITIKNHIMEIKVTLPLDAHILLAESDLARLIREVDDPDNNFPKLKLLLDSETFQPDKLIRLLEKRQLNSPTITAMEELEKMFAKLKVIAAKYDTSLQSPNPMIDRRDISKAFSTVLRNCIKTMRKTVSDCGVTGTVGLTTLTSDIDAIHMLRVVLENVEALVKWYNAQLSILVPCVECVMEQSTQPHMFFVNQLEEAYVQKSIQIAATHETAIVCPAGHKKTVLCTDGQSRCVVALSKLAPDITMNDLYKFVVPFSKLEMFGELGRGSYGKVMKAKYRGFEVAVKQMLSYDINDPNLDESQKKAVLQSYQDFRHEAWIMSSLSHPHIVKMYGVCLYPLCMVTEFVPNGDLFKFLQVEKDIDWKFKLKMALDIAKGMQYLHSISPPLIHRDLKSPNVLMESFDPKAEVNCKVADFGLTRILTTNLKSDEFYNPRWLAPEVMTGDDYTEKVDVFSLGVILWEILTQERPHENIKFDRQIEELVLSGARLPIPEDCPQEYKGLMTECWQQNPATRPSCSNVVHSLDRMLSQLTDDRRKTPDQWSSGTIKRNHSGSILDKKKISNGFESTSTLRPEGSLVFDYKLDAAEPEHTSIPKVIYKPEDLNLQMVQKIETEERPQYMVYLEKFNQVWIGRHDGVIVVYSSRSYRQVDFWPAHTSRVNALLRVGDNVWSCADDGSICMWEAKNFCLSAKAQFPHQILCMCAFNIEVLCGASDGTVSRWDRHTSKLHMLGSITINGPVCSILADDRGKVWIGSESEIHVVSGMTYKLVKSWKAHSKAIKCLYQVGEYVWSASDDMKLGVWNVVTMNLSKMISHHTGRVMCLLYINGHVWSGSFDKSFVLWDSEKIECLGGIERHTDTVRAMTVVKDTVWVASLDKSISIWKYSKNASGAKSTKKGFVLLGKSV